MAATTGNDGSDSDVPWSDNGVLSMILDVRQQPVHCDGRQETESGTKHGCGSQPHIFTIYLFELIISRLEYSLRSIREQEENTNETAISTSIPDVFFSQFAKAG